MYRLLLSIVFIIAASFVYADVGSSIDQFTSEAGAGFNSVTSDFGDITSDAGAAVAYVTSVGGHAYSVVSEDGGEAFTLASNGVGEVTSIGGGLYTIATAAYASATGLTGAASPLHLSPFVTTFGVALAGILVGIRMVL